MIAKWAAVVEPDPPTPSRWDRKIEPRKHQIGTFFPKDAWGKPGGAWGIHK
jgi:hypothetical protein